MRKAGAKDYKLIFKKNIKSLPKKPISFEGFGDDYNSMKRQALKLINGKNFYVKIPFKIQKVFLWEKLSKN